MCSWTGWSPCTVSCLSRGSRAIYSQQWRQYRCSSDMIMNFHPNSSSVIRAKFRSCAHMIPLCVSDEGFSEAFQNYFLLSIFISGILLLLLPNIIIGLSYTRVWVWTSRKIGEKSEKSVRSNKELSVSDFESHINY